MLDPNDLLSVVREDITYLRDEWNADISDAALRRASPVLRRLLVDGELQRAWKAAGFDKQPQIHGVCLTSCMEGVDPNTVVYASAGGAEQQGTQMAGFLVRDIAVPQAEINDRSAREPPMKVWSLTEFIAAPAINTRGVSISRRRVVKYFSNKLGGAHHDVRRGNDDEDRAFAILDRLARDVRLQVLGKPMLYFDLLSIGQAVANSQDLKKLIGQ